MNIDYELLYKQRQALIKKQFNTDYNISIDIIDGLVNLLDALLDRAEEEDLISQKRCIQKYEELNFNGE